jgi:RND family efflux transporter MFP subunit
VFLEAAVTENLLPSLTQGAQLAVFIPAYNVTRTATIDQIAPAADQRTRLFQVRIVIDNADGSLRGGLTAQAKIETSRVSGVVAVPREALVTSGTEHAVFVVADGIARRRVVQTGLLGETLAEITSGLAEGERVVVAGVDFLRDGTAVNVVRDVTP